MNIMSMLSVEFFIAFRHLKVKRKGVFSLITAFIAIGGTALGVAALVVTLAVMSGFQNDIRNKILGIQPHIVVVRIDGESFKDYPKIEDKIKAKSDILSISPFIYRQGIIRSLDLSTSLIIKAVDYKNENNMLGLSKQITVSDMSFNGEKIGEKSIILGSELAKNIAVSAGDKVVLMFPGNFGSIPKMFKFTVSAVIQSGMYDFDSSLGLIDLEEGQKLFSMQNEITGLDVHINNFDKTVTTAMLLQKDLSYPYKVKTWIEMNKNLFSALKLEKIMMFLILGLIVLVAAFNIISNLLFLSVQKSKEIGIMSAMGFSKLSISKIFFYEGLIVGSSGTVLGVISGLAASFLLKYFNIFNLPKGIYYVDKLPIAVIPTDIIMIVSCVFIITITAGIYPAYQVSKLDPLEAIRYG